MVFLWFRIADNFVWICGSYDFNGRCLRSGGIKTARSEGGNRMNVETEWEDETRWWSKQNDGLNWMKSKTEWWRKRAEGSNRMKVETYWRLEPNRNQMKIRANLSLKPNKDWNRQRPKDCRAARTFSLQTSSFPSQPSHFKQKKVPPFNSSLNSVQTFQLFLWNPFFSNRWWSIKSILKNVEWKTSRPRREAI
jgi:hypothetical protein